MGFVDHEAPTLDKSHTYYPILANNRVSLIEIWHLRVSMFRRYEDLLIQAGSLNGTRLVCRRGGFRFY